MTNHRPSIVWSAPQQAERDHLAMHLHKLITVHKVKPQNILIISCQSQKRSAIYAPTGQALSYLPQGNATPMTYQLNPLHDGIIPDSSPVATIRTAKGLESDVVILVELTGLREGQFASMSREHLRAYIFVGVSRARSRLIIFGRESDIFLP